MREIHNSLITEAVGDLFLDICIKPDKNLQGLLEKAQKNETSPYGKVVLDQLLQNIDVASETGLPLCQDTGMAVVFLEIGQDVHVVGSIEDAVNAGVRIAYETGYFRKSVISPLGRVNTMDNTPAIINYSLVAGDNIKISAAPKGFGSENMSRIAMLTPAAGKGGVMDFIVDVVRQAGGNPCPPVTVGVGIGGTFEYAALLAKKSILRELGTPSKDTELADMEAQLLEEINALDIGPMGMGGKTTALAVHIESFPTHIAGLPVAVNIQCHSVRHGEITI